MQSRRRFVISAFILLNILAIPLVTTAPIADQNPIQKLVMPYLVWTRLLQQWRLFVPSPRTYALKYRAEITFRDGSVKTWQRPYPPHWDFFERHLAYNFQKWDLAAGYLENRGPLRVDLAQYLVRLHAQPANPPQLVTFIRSEAARPPPREEGYVMNDDSELEWRDSVVFKYFVDEGRIEP